MASRRFPSHPGSCARKRCWSASASLKANWREGAKKDKNFLESETPLFVGRAVAALAADPNALDRTGHLYSSWELARAYGFTDADGRRPDWGAYQPEFAGMPTWLLEALATGFRLQHDWLKTLTARTERYLKNWVEPMEAAARPRKRTSKRSRR
jgi:hypothetical protein